MCVAPAQLSPFFISLPPEKKEKYLTITCLLRENTL